MPTKSISFVKIGLGYSQIYMARYSDFCRISAKVISFSSVNCGVTGPNFTKFLHDAEKFGPLNLLKSELRYFYPFRNASTTNEDMSLISPISPILDFNWLPWQRPLSDCKMICQVNKHFHPSTIREILVKIGPLDLKPPGLEVDH